MPEFQKKKHLQDIKPNHLARYHWAIKALRDNIPDDGYVLDAACGVGYGSFMIANSGYRVHAIDRSKEAVHWHFDYFTHNRIRVSMGDILDVPLDEYDAIISIETIEHVPDASAWIERMAGASKLIIGTVPNEDVMPFHAANNEYHFRHYTKDQFDAAMPGEKEWFTQYGKFKDAEMVPGADGMTLGAICRL